MKILGAFARLYRLTSGWRSVFFQQGKERVLVYQSMIGPKYLTIEQLIGERRTILITQMDDVLCFRGLPTFNGEGLQRVPEEQIDIYAQELRDLCDWIEAAHPRPFIPTNWQLESSDGAFEAALIFQRCEAMMTFFESACLAESDKSAEDSLRVVRNHIDLYDPSVMVNFQRNGLGADVWFHANGKVSQFGYHLGENDSLPLELLAEEMRQLRDRLASATFIVGR